MLNRKIDVHVHAFPEKLMNAIYSWFQREGWEVPYDGWNAEKIFDYPGQNGFEKFLVLLYVHKKGMAPELNDWLFEQAKERPEIIPVGSVHHEDDVETETHKCLGELGFAGMKLHCQVQNVRMNDERLFPLYEALIHYDKPVIVHAGTAPVDYTGTVGVKYFAQVMERYPELKVQVAHLGMNETEAFLRLAEELPGVMFDTAALDAKSMSDQDAFPPPEQFKEWIERLPDRMMYGSDFPLLNGKSSEIERQFVSLDLDPAVKQALFYDNAKRFWGI
ncbi:amidohydrolase family protein [Alkalihalobacterium chitinilyticum]|uniref:Amidohydrolase n=1 Tax=Alkalihalobacterium chitinilyticum TaxID=2980103 RepID=A0ABT5VDQ5_9BACI|nr:amidohydrolase family protein [Alkalihalobacterium chitinilyticum]MDE5413591.1 amidohydrolase [Alkalihalobacterium chitinilyticum]